jgi:predicted SprT family Zn-dependent metalloprotease
MDLYDAQQLALDLMGQHGLTPVWRFRFSRAVTIFGSCQHGTRTIALSRPLAEINEVAEVRDTILHEIAHALAGPGAGHGPRWRKIARELGARPERCTGADAKTVPGAWVGTCPGCGRTIERHRRSKAALACAQCCKGVYRPEFRFVWTRA